MNGKRNIRFFVFFLLSIAMLISYTTFATAAEKNAPKEIVWYRMADMAGPYASVNAESAESFDAAMEYINSTGGCNGVPMRRVDHEDLGKLEAALSYYVEWKEAKIPFFMHYSHSNQIEALKPRVDKDKICVYTNSPTFMSLYPPGYVFGSTASYSDQFGLFCDWLVKTQPAPHKIAICTWNIAFGRGFWSKEAKDYMKKKGIQLVAEEFYPPTTVDVSTQLTRIYAKGGDGTWIYNNTLGAGPAALIKSAESLGLLGKLHFAGGPWSCGRDTAKIIGPELAHKSGWVAIGSTQAWGDKDRPGVKLMRSAHYKIHPPDYPGQMGTLNTWQIALTVRKVYAKAAKEVGWKNINGEAIRNAFLSLEHDPMTELGFRTSYTKNRPSLLWAQMYTYDENGVDVTMVDWEPLPNLSPETYWTKGPLYEVPKP